MNMISTSESMLMKQSFTLVMYGYAKSLQEEIYVMQIATIITRLHPD